MNVHVDKLEPDVIDFAALKSSAGLREASLAKLRACLHAGGFFYLSGHGLSPQLIDDVFTLSKRFFALPAEEKLAIEMVNSPHFRGYTRLGGEFTRGKRDWREQIDINTETACLSNGLDAPAWKRLIGPNQWPAALPQLKPLLLAYQAEITRVGIELLKAIAAALWSNEAILDDLYTPAPTQLVKIIHYIGCEAESQQGVGPHKDGGLITLLLQDENKGLRVQNEQAVWTEVPPVPGTLVVNAGELLELLTDGYIRAAVHDVVAPPVGTERYSIAFFLGARLDAVVPALELPLQQKAEKRSITVDPLNPLFREVGINQLKNRLRSHPDVARRHYADVKLPDELAL